MGGIFGKRKQEQVRVLMLGLDDAGKTTVLNCLSKNEIERTIPTVGFNLATIQYDNRKIDVWDVGGQETIRSLWQHYFRSTDALIFVVDASRKDRLPEARAELHKIIGDAHLIEVPLFVMGNKVDLEEAMTQEELEKGLELFAARNVSWKLMMTSGKTQVGVHEVMVDVMSAINQRKKK